MLHLRYIVLIFSVSAFLVASRPGAACARGSAPRASREALRRAKRDHIPLPGRLYGLPLTGAGMAGGGFGLASALHIGTLYGFATGKMALGTFFTALVSTATTAHLVAIGAAAVGVAGLATFAAGLVVRGRAIKKNAARHDAGHLDESVDSSAYAHAAAQAARENAALHEQVGQLADYAGRLETALDRGDGHAGDGRTRTGGSLDVPDIGGLPSPGELQPETAARQQTVAQ